MNVAVDDHERRLRAVPRARHHGHRPAAARDHRRADHHARACGGCSATPASAKRCARPRPTPTSPASPASARSSMSTAIWTIAGFLSAVSVILYATQQGSAELVSIGPETLLLGLTAALIGAHDVVPERRRAARSSSGSSTRCSCSTSRTRPGSCSSCCSSSCSCSSRASAAPTTPAARASRSRRASRRSPSGCARSGGCGACRRSSPASRSLVAIVAAARRPPVGAPPHVLDHPRVRDLRGLGDRAHRLGRPALARPDGVRRHRRAERAPRSRAASR